MTQTFINPDTLVNEQMMAKIAERTVEILGRDPHYQAAFINFTTEAGVTRAAGAQIIVEEALKFLVATAQPGKPRMVPGRLVDCAWHVLILDTRLYAGICGQLGVFVHHNPDPSTSMWDEPGNYKATIEWLERLGLEPNEHVWQPSSAYCADHEPTTEEDDNSGNDGDREAGWDPERCSSCSSG